MVPRARPTPTRFPTNILYAPVDSTLSHSKYVKSVGREVMVEVSLTV